MMERVELANLKLLPVNHMTPRDYVEVRWGIQEVSTRWFYQIDDACLASEGICALYDQYDLRILCSL
jgi:hypothetical protein